MANVQALQRIGTLRTHAYGSFACSKVKAWYLVFLLCYIRIVGSNVQI